MLREDLSAHDMASLRSALTSPDPLTWVITGDSITHGLVHTQGERCYADHLHELIRGELARARDVVINTGISGHRITDILGDWNRRVAAWAPDVVTLMIGTNDCATGERRPFASPEDFAASLRQFVAQVRAEGAIPALVTPPAVDVRNAPERARIGEFSEAVRLVARESDVILADAYARFAEIGAGAAGACPTDVVATPWRLMSDPFHPNAQGHALLALLLSDALGIHPDPSRTIARLQGIVAGA